VSGNHITEKQVRLYMKFRKDFTQEVAASKVDISVSSARRIENGRHQPNQAKRQWRTRSDPLEAVWESVVVPILQQDELITPVGVFDHLCESHSDDFPTTARRTLERRIKKWRQLHGSAKDVMFLQHHESGLLGICDFTHVKSPITIGREPCKHMLFNYRLAASGWQYCQVVYGGESFAAFSDSLQKAFRESGGVPKEVRTDSLSAAYRNHDNAEAFTERYKSLMAHYGFTATRNNTGVAHENGVIESSNRHVKAQLEQALRIRGSFDFNCRDDYEGFIQQLVGRRNKRINTAFIKEQRQLQPLPPVGSVNYSIEYVRVSRTSTINVKRVTYTVPSRLIGSRLRVQVYDNRLALYLGHELTYTLERVYAQGSSRKRSVNYKHVIDALVKKPQAFRCSQWRDELLPNEDYRCIWQYVNGNMKADDACRYIVRVLHLASKEDNEIRLGRFIMQQLNTGRLPSLFDCQERFQQQTRDIPQLQVGQHSLKQYGLLLQGGRHD
jgi:hypothetical protein